MTGGVFFLRADVEAVQRAAGLRLQRLHLLHADVPDTGAVGNVARIGFRALEGADLAAPVGAVLEVLASQGPADRPVAQRHHPVGDAGIDQRLGADDRAGAAGAIDDDRGLGIRRGAAGAQHQLRTGHADGAGDVHGGVFVETPDIEDFDVGVAFDQRRDFFRSKRRRVAPRLHQFAKSLGVGIDVLEQFVTRRRPGLQPAVELANIGVAQCREPFRRDRHEAFAGIIDNDRHVLARQPRLGFERDPLSRHVGGKQRMAGGEDGLVPDIEQRDFIAQQQGGADLRGGDGWYCHRPGILDEGRSGMNSSIVKQPSRRIKS